MELEKKGGDGKDATSSGKNLGAIKEKVAEMGEQAEDDFQLSFFQLDDPVLENIKEELTKIEIDTLTPVEALFKLNEIKKMVGGKWKLKLESWNMKL